MDTDSLQTSDKRVVKDNKYDEDAVKECECNEQLVEGIIHLLGRQNDDGENISNKTKKTKSWLKFPLHKMSYMKFILFTVNFQ